MNNSYLYNDSVFKKPVSRRKFLKATLSAIAALSASHYFPKIAYAKSPSMPGRAKKNKKGKFDLVLAKGDDPYQMTVQAINAMGGMERFVKKGDTNIAYTKE